MRPASPSPRGAGPEGRTRAPGAVWKARDVPVLVAPALQPGTLTDGPQPVLAGDGLVLRPWSDDDVDPVVAAYADPGIQRWHVRSMTPDEAAEWVAARNELWASETGAEWAVTEDGRLVGRAGLNHVNLTDGLGNLAYWVVPEARGRRVAPRAVALVTGWAFAAGLPRLQLEHSTRNVASCRVAERSGFAVEGTLRSHWVHADGRHDVHLHARVRADVVA
jgi:RimJ/RimL family protein N-acetyltransferase